MSASNLNEKNQAFGRLLHDLHQDSLHTEIEVEREFLPKMKASASLEDLRQRLRRRYRRSRITPTSMYLPRIALTVAILMSCAVAYMYIRRLDEIKMEEKNRKQQHIQSLDSLMHSRNIKEKNNERY